jgi:IS30 family transposase
MKTLKKIPGVVQIIRNNELNKEKRTKIKTYQRVFIAKYLRENGYTLQEIGKLLNRSHSTIIYFLDIYESKLKDPKFKDSVYEISLALGNNKIFDDPEIQNIKNALSTNDCEKLKKIVTEMYNTVTNIN